MNSIGTSYRVGCSRWWKHWLSLRTYTNYIKWKWQRANRGWADRDTWSLDHYLASWLPDALRHLKATKHGVPCNMFPDTADKYGDYTKEEWAQAEHKWALTLNKMIVAFDAHRRLVDWDYEHLADEDIAAAMKRDEELFQEGAALFIEHFGSLWD